MPASVINATVNGLNATGGNTAGLELQVSGTTAVTIDTGQRTTFPTTISVGNATPSTSGAGITFPATQSASSDANTLDDYEEGTFTPTLYGATTAGTPTYNYQQGYYTKIGRLVNIILYVDVNAIPTGIAGSIQIGGLPFTSSSNGYAGYACLSVNQINNVALPANYYQFIPRIANSVTYIDLMQQASNTYRYVDAANLTAGRIFMSISGAYFTT